MLAGATLEVATGSTSLGTTTAGTVVEAGGTLKAVGYVTTSEPLVLNGTGVGGKGALWNSASTLSLNGSMEIASDARLRADSTTYLYGPLSGSAVLEKTGTGYLYLGGNNSFTGAFTVSGGTLGFSNPTALGGGVEAITVSTGGTVQFSGTWSESLLRPVVLQGGRLVTDFIDFVGERDADGEFDGLRVWGHALRENHLGQPHAHYAGRKHRRGSFPRHRRAFQLHSV